MAWSKKRWNRRTGRGGSKQQYKRGGGKKQGTLLTLQDGERAAPGWPTTPSTTAAVLIAGATDLGLLGGGNDAGQQRAKFVSINMLIQLLPNTNIDVPVIAHYYAWIMACPAVVATDWVTNGRKPTDTGIGQIATACPYQLLSPIKQLLFSNQNNLGTDVAVQVEPSAGKCNLRNRYPATLRFPFQVYMFISCQQVILPGAGGFNTADMVADYEYRLKIRHPDIF